MHDSISYMMTSSNGNIFRVTGHMCGNSPVPGEFPAQRQVTRSFDAFVDLRPNKRLSKQSWGWLFKTPSRPLWRHRNVSGMWCFIILVLKSDLFTKPCAYFLGYTVCAMAWQKHWYRLWLGTVRQHANIGINVYSTYYWYLYDWCLDLYLVKRNKDTAKPLLHWVISKIKPRARLQNWANFLQQHLWI